MSIQDDPEHVSGAFSRLVYPHQLLEFLNNVFVRAVRADHEVAADVVALETLLYISL